MGDILKKMGIILFSIVFCIITYFVLSVGSLEVISQRTELDDVIDTTSDEDVIIDYTNNEQEDSDKKDSDNENEELENIIN